MDARSILLAMLPVGFTLVNYAILRDMLWGILLGSKSKKTAEKLCAEQSLIGKWTQGYIGKSIDKYQKQFSVWKLVKQLTFFFAAAQLIAFTLLVILGVPFWIVAIICGAIALIDIVLFIVMMNRTSVSGHNNNRKGAPWEFEKAAPTKQKSKKRKH